MESGSVVGANHIRISSNTSDATPEQRQSAEGGANDTNTDFEQRKEELSKELNAQDVVGLDPASDEPSGMKVIVFRTAKIPGAVSYNLVFVVITTDEYQTLEAFLTTSEQLGDSPRLHYVFASSTSPLKNPVPATTKESFRTLGKSPFLKKSTNECIEAWHEMIEPLLECRSMIATHCFVVLDETTAKGQNLVKVVAFIPDGSGDFCTRYVSFAALSTGLLKGLEMLTVDLRMFGLDERNVVMEDAWGLTEWEVEEDVVEVSEGS